MLDAGSVLQYSTLHYIVSKSNVLSWQVQVLLNISFFKLNTAAKLNILF